MNYTRNTLKLRKALERLGYWVYWSRGGYGRDRRYTVHGDGKPGLLTGFSLESKERFIETAHRMLAHAQVDPWQVWFGPEGAGAQ